MFILIPMYYNTMPPTIRYKIYGNISCHKYIRSVIGSIVLENNSNKLIYTRICLRTASICWKKRAVLIIFYYILSNLARRDELRLPNTKTVFKESCRVNICLPRCQYNIFQRALAILKEWGWRIFRDETPDKLRGTRFPDRKCDSFIGTNHSFITTFFSRTFSSVQ